MQKYFKFKAGSVNALSFHGGDTTFIVPALILYDNKTKEAK